VSGQLHLCGPQSRSEPRGEEKILDPTGSNSDPSSLVQPVASRYTYYAIPAPYDNIVLFSILKSPVTCVAVFVRIVAHLINSAKEVGNVEYTL
jgi:hypothetical protein